MSWTTCEGSENGYRHRSGGAFAVSRRQLMVGVGMGTLGWATTRSALAGMTVNPKLAADRTGGNVLVVVFLRGGMDGLSAVTPYAEERIYSIRPNLAVAAPKGSAKDRLVDLDGFFGLHPSLAPLGDLYSSKQMAVIHAIGSQDQTRSHFEAMSAMDRGAADDGLGPAGGWITRYLLATGQPGESPLRAVAFGTVMPDSLRGATNAAALPSLDSYRLTSDKHDLKELTETIRRLYGKGQDVASTAGMETLQVIEAVNRLNPDERQPRHGAKYPTTGMGTGLQQAATLIRARVGMEVATVDVGGWDTHVAQGTTAGWLPTRLDEVGQALAAFMQDLGPDSASVTTVVMSEFGRRAYENGGLGTDHGRGGCAFVLGGGVQGGQVFGKWPGLKPEQLEGPGDLRVTTDYRALLGEVLSQRLGADPKRVFESSSSRLGIIRS
jgi:uncharacterized protein (DUF1501 family)